MGRAITTGNKRGFTLLELMIVIALAMLMAGFSLWGYHSLHKSADISRDINKIAAILKTSRNWAFTRKKAILVTITDTTLRAQWTDTKGVSCDIMQPVTLSEKYSLSSTPGPDIHISQRGVFIDTGKIFRTASISSSSGKEDCIAISRIRAIPGKYNGTTCVTN